MKIYLVASGNPSKGTAGDVCNLGAVWTSLMQIYLGAQTNPGKTHADNKAMGKAMKIFLCMGGPSEGSNAGTHAISKAMKIHLVMNGQPKEGDGGRNGTPSQVGRNLSNIYLGLSRAGAGDRSCTTMGSPGNTSRAIADAPRALPVLRILLSYHYYKDERIDELLDQCFGDLPIDVFADSGAFSALTVGKPINEDDYIAWVNRWKHRFTAVSAPDVIGDPSATSLATDRMLAKVSGVPVLPVFHVGEPWSYLEKWANDPRIDYLAFGGMVPYTRRLKLLDAWITKAFTIVPPKVRVHGFGLTTWSMLLKHPFYSVDSSSWTAGFRFAQLQLFDIERGKFIDVSMAKRTELLKHAKLLEEYGLRPSEAQASGYNRDQIVATAVLSWQRAEAWLARRKGATTAAYLSCGANPGGPNAKAGTGDVRSLGKGIGTAKEGV